VINADVCILSPAYAKDYGVGRQRNIAKEGIDMGKPVGDDGLVF
jgi:hypothetical protein